MTLNFLTKQQDNKTTTHELKKHTQRHQQNYIERDIKLKQQNSTACTKRNGLINPT